MLYRALALVALMFTACEEKGGLPDTVVVEAQPEVIDIYDEALCKDTSAVIVTLDKVPSGMTVMACWQQTDLAEGCQPVTDWWLMIPYDGDGPVEVFWGCFDRPTDFTQDGGHLLVSYW
jgi:hypothetical protein